MPSCRRVRTTNSVPPEITDLAATFTPPMSLTLTYTVSKAGSLWLAPRKAGQPVPTAQEVLAAVATRSTAGANFTATVPVDTAAVTATQTLCVADGDTLVVYVVARDTEGQWSGRQDNTSPLKRLALCVCCRQSLGIVMADIQETNTPPLFPSQCRTYTPIVRVQTELLARLLFACNAVCP